MWAGAGFDFRGVRRGRYCVANASLEFYGASRTWHIKHLAQLKTYACNDSPLRKVNPMDTAKQICFAACWHVKG